MGKKTWTNDEILKLKEVYSEVGLKETARLLGKTEKSVDGKVYKLGLRVEKLGSHKRIGKTILENVFKDHPSIKRDFFKTWTAESAYVMGYCWADGSITTGERKILSFGCVESDRDVLDKIKSSMGLHHSIYTIPACEKKFSNGNVYKVKAFSRFKVTISEFVDDLIAKGMVSRKSFVNPDYPEVPDSLLNHFFRGYFDGDGCFCYPTLMICGSEKFIKGLAAQVTSLLKLDKFSFSPQSTIFRASWQKIEDIQKIVTWMYPEEDFIFMKRRRDLLEPLKKLEKSVKRIGREGKSGYSGVGKHENGRWVARFRRNGKNALGFVNKQETFPFTEEGKIEAAKQVNSWFREYYPGKPVPNSLVD